MTHKFRKHPDEFGKVEKLKSWIEVVKADMGLAIGDEVILEEYYPEGFYKEAPLPFYTGRMLFSEVKKIIKCFKDGIEDGYVVLVLNRY